VDNPFDINTHEFDVAVSFPGEHRAYVKAVVDALIETYKIEPSKIFYDEFYTAFLAIPSSDTILQDIYRKRSKLIVTFLCEKYQEKEWCGLEARAIRDLIKVRENDKIMLVRMDDGEVEGFFGIDGWIDARKHNSAKVAGFINQRLTGKLEFSVSADPVKTASKLPKNNLRGRNTSFSGREKELNDIHDVLKKGGAVCVKQAIAGLGGVGKTQLALEYAYRFGHNYADAIWWVDAEKSPKDDLWGFAAEYGIIPENRDAALQIKDEEFIRRLNSWFDDHHSFLLIFDNVEIADDINPFIERVKTGHVLITTRDRKLKLYNANSFELDIFTLDEARDFMRKRLPQTTINDELTLDELIERLGRLPLALEQAAAYMEDADNYCDFAEYLVLISEQCLELLGDKETKPVDYHEIVTTTWEISFNKLSEAARQLFNICAYMSPDKIPLDFFLQSKTALPKLLGEKLNNRITLNEVIQSLTKYALVKREEDFLSIHRLVQEVARDELAKVNDTQWLACCLDMARDVFKYEYGNKQSMDAFEQNVPHVLAIAEYAEKALCGDEEAQEEIAWLYHEAGSGFYYGGKYREALRWHEKALAIREKVLGEEHLDTAATYSCIALGCDDQGEYDNALEWHEKALTINEKVLGKEHLETAKNYNNIANVYNNQGEYAKALEWYEKALAIFEKVLGKEHPDTANTYNNIAMVYNGQGKYTKALEWLEKALTIREKVLVKEHPDTANTYNNIANVYYNQGEYVKALEWYYKDLAISEKVLGKEHPSTATTYNNIAVVYENQGDYDKALELYKKALAIRENMLGPDHPHTKQTRRNIELIPH